MEERVYIEEKLYVISRSFKRTKRRRVSIKDDKVFVERVFRS